MRPSASNPVPLIALMTLLAGCAYNIDVEHRFPEVVSQPRELSAVLVLDPEFRAY